MGDRPLALVTGASGGIGAEVARALAPAYDVLLGGRDAAALERLAERIPGSRPWPVDLTDSASVAAAARGIDALGALVHSVGVASVAPLRETPVEVWRHAFEVNVVAVAELTRLLLPALRRARGRVVLVNSGQGLRATAGWGPYAASKFALRAYADILRAEEAGHGLRVTSVFPGRTATDMQRDTRAAEGGEYEPDQYLRPASVAEAVRYALSAPSDAQVTELIVRPVPRT